MIRPLGSTRWLTRLARVSVLLAMVAAWPASAGMSIQCGRAASAAFERGCPRCRSHVRVTARPSVSAAATARGDATRSCCRVITSDPASGPLAQTIRVERALESTPFSLDATAFATTDAWLHGTDQVPERFSPPERLTRQQFLVALLRI